MDAGKMNARQYYWTTTSLYGPNELGKKLVSIMTETVAQSQVLSEDCSVIFVGV